MEVSIWFVGVVDGADVCLQSERDDRHNTSGNEFVKLKS